MVFNEFGILTVMNILDANYKIDDIRKIINESVWGDFTSWVKETGKSSVEGFKEFVTTAKAGMGEFVDEM